jgi:hypothetical protein
MSDVLREALSERADAVDPPRLDTQAVVASGEQRLRRRRLGAVAASVLAVALVVGVPAAVLELRHESRSVEQPEVPTPPEKGDEKVVTGPRPLVYAEGPELHVGDRTLALGKMRAGHGIVGASPDSMVSLHVTDAGAVFATFDGRIWFSDGSSAEHIGTVPGPRREPGHTTFVHGLPQSWIETDDAGSRAAWLEHPSRGRPQLVVYDTAARAVQSRVVLPVPQGVGKAQFPGWEDAESGLYGDHVYWHLVIVPRYGSIGPPRLMRTKLSTGTTERATRRMLAAERYGNPRTLVIGKGAEAEVVTGRDGQAFQRFGSRLEPVRFDHDITNANYRVPAFHPVTGEQLRFRAPARLAESNELVLFQWMDDDRFALSTRPLFGSNERRDLVICRVSTERCEIAVRKGPGAWLLLPEASLPG